MPLRPALRTKLYAVKLLASLLRDECSGGSACNAAHVAGARTKIIRLIGNTCLLSRTPRSGTGPCHRRGYGDVYDKRLVIWISIAACRGEVSNPNEQWEGQR
jgi:hypothetical protein